ncbi:MAG: hypothetical protein ATN32_07360 [Candidatus Epulonipiscium fishelsonii]|nr:MAG: hypothetical protein ATN32_07360 [Epulopiscium sp. AS2M-Bin002]
MAIISIIIPVYNVENYLKECLDSVINQTFKDIEILIINDGSTDNSLSICKQYAKQDKRIRLINRANGGLSAARNLGIQLATGQYITFIDSDDYIDLNMCYNAIKYFRNYKCDIVTFDFNEIRDGIVYIKNQTDLIKHFSNEEAVKAILLNYPFTTSAWGKFYKIDLFDEIRFPVNMIYEDVATIYKVVALSEKVIFSSKSKYYYRRNRPGSILANPELDKIFQRNKISKDILKFIKTYYPNLLKYAKCLCVRENMYIFYNLQSLGINDYKYYNIISKNIRPYLQNYLISNKINIQSKFKAFLLAINYKL